MAYTAIPTFTDVVATTSNFNTYIRDNQRALKDPPSQNYEANEGSNYTTTSSTYGNVDVSDFSLSITTTGGDVVIGFIGSVQVSANSGLIDVSVDSTRIINNTSGGILFVNTTTPKIMSFYRIVQGLSAGSHTFILQWKVATGGDTLTMYAGAGTASYDVHPQFWVRELT